MRCCARRKNPTGGCRPAGATRCTGSGCHRSSVQEEPTTSAGACSETVTSNTGTAVSVDARFATPLAGALTLAAMGIPQIPVKRGEKKAFLKEWENFGHNGCARKLRRGGNNFRTAISVVLPKRKSAGFGFWSWTKTAWRKRIAGDTKATTADYTASPIHGRRVVIYTSNKMPPALPWGVLRNRK